MIKLNERSVGKKKFFATDWRSMMSKSALAEAKRLNEMIPIIRAEHGQAIWNEEGPFKGERRWNLWAKAYKDDFLVNLEKNEKDVFGIGKRQLRYGDGKYEQSKINFIEDIEFNEESKAYELDYGNFIGFIFPGSVIFTGITFICDAFFEDAYFMHYADFNKMKFQGVAFFSETFFLEVVDFDETEFRSFISFRTCCFLDIAGFKDTIFHKGGMLINSVFVSFADFRLMKSLQEMDFYGARFFGPADFSHSKIDGGLILSRSKFGPPESNIIQVGEYKVEYTSPDIDYSVPDFIGMQVPRVPDFGDVIIKRHPEMVDANASSKFRKLKEMAAQVSNHSKELEFFREELIYKPSGVEATFWTLPLVRSYEALSRCGTSAVRPAVWLIVFMFLFSFLYYSLNSGQVSAYEDSDAALMFLKFSFHQAFPFLGMGGGETEAVVVYLYGGYEGIPHLTAFWSGVQKFISLMLEFLIGLGIRNYYRM